VATGLAMAGEQVVDVPAQLAARARLLNSGHARKTDALDAASVAAVGFASSPASSSPRRGPQRGAAVAV